MTDDLKVLRALASKPRWAKNYTTGWLTIDITVMARLDYNTVEVTLQQLRHQGLADHAAARPHRWALTAEGKQRLRSVSQ
jgi:hypothetical protein